MSNSGTDSSYIDDELTHSKKENSNYVKSPNL